MRGFIGGSFALIVLYAALQRSGSAAVSGLSGALAAGLHYLLSAEVAGIPQVASATTQTTSGRSSAGSVITI